jgi:hypothetical protein
MDFPMQESGSPAATSLYGGGSFDMREHLDPRRLTIVMWDQAFLLRHVPGESYADYDKVLDETVERGYNTLRLDPLPQLIDLNRPDYVFNWPDPQTPYMPWCWSKAGEGPLGRWLIDFMERVLRRKLHYTLSAWWFTAESRHSQLPFEAQGPHTHMQAAELWATLLGAWERRFGLEGLVYVDLANEVPYFLPGFMQRFEQETGRAWGQHEPGTPPAFTPQQVAFLSEELNSALSFLQRSFPSVRFTASIHGDLRWLQVPVQFDCLDVHFYADADRRWRERTRFGSFMPDLYRSTAWHREFSDRCTATGRAIAPMLRAAQRAKLAQFAAWSVQYGMPLTTSESWASWYYFDSPDLDWRWLLDWAEWSVEDAIEYQMWGWTPHNYCQPQFRNWQDVGWHRRLTERFLQS